MERKDCSGIRGKISKTMQMKTKKLILYTYNKKRKIYVKQAFLYVNIHIYTYIHTYIERQTERQR